MAVFAGNAFSSATFDASALNPGPAFDGDAFNEDGFDATSGAPPPPGDPAFNLYGFEETAFHATLNAPALPSPAFAGESFYDEGFYAEGNTEPPAVPNSLYAILAAIGVVPIGSHPIAAGVPTGSTGTNDPDVRRIVLRGDLTLRIYLEGSI